MPESARLDKWLWAARFFKTRSLAQQAVRGGKVVINNQSPKASRLVRPGDRLCITKGEMVFEVDVREVGDKRVSAPLARAMYTETEAGRRAREARIEQRRAVGPSAPRGRPDKRERRAIRRRLRGK